MKPSGKVIINGQTFDAQSESGFLPIDLECVVVGQGIGGLVVRRVDPDKTIANQGQAIETTAARRSQSQVDVIDAVERQAIMAAHYRAVQIGFALTLVFGLAAGGIVGWQTSLLLPALIVGAIAMPLLYAMTGLVNRLNPSSEHPAKFRPSMLYAMMGILGASIGAILGFQGGEIPGLIEWTIAGTIIGLALSLLVQLI